MALRSPCLEPTGVTYLRGVVAVAGLYEELRVDVGDCSCPVRLRVSGELDCSSVAVLREVLRAATATGVGDVELDMSSTAFCDAAGVGALVMARSELLASGRGLRIVKASRPVRRVLGLSGTCELLFAPRSSGTSAAALEVTSEADYE
jgi:anti-anti-sigma factor